MGQHKTPLPIIPYRPMDEPTVCIKLNLNWIAAITGILYPARYHEAWEGSLEENRQARQDVLDIIHILETASEDCMTNDCNCVVTVIVRHRIDPITLELQISIDDGETWIPDPQSPANNLIEQPPPVTRGISANKCDAATNGKQHLEDWIAGVSGTFSTVATLFEFGVQIILLIANLILAAATGGALTLAQIAELEALGAFLHECFEAGQAAWDSYWTSDETDKLLCALVCHISDDGSFTQAGFEGVIQELQAKLTPAPQAWLMTTMLGNNGRVGLCNMCSYGAAADADCDSCLPCSSCNFSTWAVQLGTLVEQTSDHMIVDTVDGGDGVHRLIVHGSNDDDCCCNVEQIADPLVNPLAAGVTECGTPIGVTVNYAYNGFSINYYALGYSQAVRVTITGNAPEDCP